MERKRETQTQELLRRLRYNKSAIFGLILVIILVLCALFADFIAPIILMAAICIDRGIDKLEKIWKEKLIKSGKKFRLSKRLNRSISKLDYKKVSILLLISTSTTLFLFYSIFYHYYYHTNLF